MKKNISKCLQKIKPKQESLLKEPIGEINHLHDEVSYMNFNQNDLIVESQRQVHVITLLELEKKKLKKNNLEKEQVLNDYKNEIKNLKEENQQKQEHIKKLLKENQDHISTLEKLKLTYSQTIKQTENDTATTQERIKELEKDLELQNEHNIQLKKQIEEITNMTLKENSTREENNTTLQTPTQDNSYIKSLKNELNDIKEDNEKYMGIIQTFIQEMKQLKKSKQEISSLIANLPDKIDLSDIFTTDQGNISIDISEKDISESEPNQISIKENFSFFKIKMVDQSKNQLGSNASENITNLKSPTEYPKSFQSHNDLIGEQYRKDSQENKQIFRRNTNSSLFHTHTDERECSMMKFEFNNLKEVIDSKNNDTIRSNRLVNSHKVHNDQFKNENETIFINAMEMNESVKDKIKNKVLEMHSEFLNQSEVHQIEAKLLVMDKIENFMIWMLDFFHGKLKWQQIQSQKHIHDKSIIKYQMLLNYKFQNLKQNSKNSKSIFITRIKSMRI